ncbi:MAG: hypothetical protein NVSMB5_20920 [Candidatus Velthaea sp.]
MPVPSALAKAEMANATFEPLGALTLIAQTREPPLPVVQFGDPGASETTVVAPPCGVNEIEFVALETYCDRRRAAAFCGPAGIVIERFAAPEVVGAVGPDGAIGGRPGAAEDFPPPPPPQPAKTVIAARVTRRVASFRLGAFIIELTSKLKLD